MSDFLRIIYQLLTVFLVFLVGWNMFKKEEKTSNRVLAAMVIVVLILRFTLIK